jgi:hypothetical protein
MGGGGGSGMTRALEWGGKVEFITKDSEQP